MEKNIKHWGQKTKAEKYLEYVNDWLTIQAISENYGMTRDEMVKLLNEGKLEHEIKIQRNYQVQNPQGKYLSFNMQGKPQFFEGIDMSYSFTLEQAETIIERYKELNLTITTKNKLYAI